MTTEAQIQLQLTPEGVKTFLPLGGELAEQ